MPLTQGAFTIEPTATVTIGEGHASDNQITINITNTAAAASKVLVIIKVKCGATTEALLEATTVRVITTNNLLAVTSPAADTKSWQTTSRGITIDGKNALSLKLSGFDSNTPPGAANVVVLVQTYNDGSGWSTAVETPLTITKQPPPEQPDSKIHYFSVNPEYILHAGQTPVTVGFYATGFDRITLFRNNQEVQNWPSNEHPANCDGSIAGTFSDQPSITTIYRLEGKPNAENLHNESIEKNRYQTVQVISPGWNQIALPQGYPARLFVNRDFSGSGMERLYGIFLDGDDNAALYSSATGVDDWRLEPGDIPSGMETSPGLAYNNSLWLIGGSCVDSDSPKSSVHCYEIDNLTGERHWNQKPDFPEGMRARAGHACVLVPRKNRDGTVVNEIWVIGGYKNGEVFGDAWRFDGSNWTQISTTGTTWAPRYMHTALSFTPASDQPTEVWIYGGTVDPATGNAATLADLWSTKDGGLTWNQSDGILPPPGAPLGAALVSFDANRSGASQRLYLSGTFLDPGAGGKGNRTSCYVFEWQWRNQRWETRPVVDGWERFEGSTFYMQAIAFNNFLFVWSLHTAITAPLLPKLNILIS